ncbi:LRRN4 C-terminal-like protein [Hyla sarda]|uniref:LRRN4 C-terminal-like protein n=1 Tax=Hyla sarda TaxID=327740 RepID=UPI0024C39AB9|nr:LRRN4 C-terminal-like protein [Hyla sarda]
MAQLLFLLLLPFLAFTTGSTQEGSNVTSLTTAAPFSDMNQTSLTQHTTKKHQSTVDKIEYIIGGSEEDYYDDDEAPTVAPTSPVTKHSCQYNRCEHLASTCEEIQRQAGGKCLCPGIDGPERTPDSPPIKEVLLGDSHITINWCSPSSTVRGYRVLHGEPGGSLEKGLDVNASFRSYTIDNLHSGSLYTVCVVAFNEAGESQVGDMEDRPDGSMPGPCRTVQTTMQSLYLGLGLGLAAVAVLLVILGYCLWRRKRNKTEMEANIEDRGIPNYTYKAGSIDQL